MKKKAAVSTLFLIFLSILIATPAYANSSWHWISQTRPLDILPIVIVITLIIEISAIKFIAKVDNTPKVIAVTTFANLVSFYAPYLLYYCITFSENYPNPQNNSESIGVSFDELLSKQPIYNAGIIFLFLTLVCEMPIVFAFLRNNTKSRKRLAIVIIAVNVFTTILTAIIERTICQGSW